MRMVLTRVTSASVAVGGVVVDELPRPGILLLVGVGHEDTREDARKLAAKAWRLRILDGELSAEQVAAPVMVISQFTLLADTRKGRRPSWNRAASGAVSQPLVAAVCEELAALGAEVHQGRFGADMAVSSVNDGPMTILLDSQSPTAG
ncbi:MAG: D-aminoacyl-tRNA deacylase [Arachnia sp.]